MKIHHCLYSIEHCSLEDGKSLVSESGARAAVEVAIFSETVSEGVALLNPFATGNPFWGQHYLDLVWGGVRGL